MSDNSLLKMVKNYREGIPFEIRLTYHVFGEIPFFQRDTIIPPCPSSDFIRTEGNLEKLYDSLNSDAKSAILGNGRLRALYEDILSTFPPKEQRVVALRFGQEDGKIRTLEEIGKYEEFLVNKERIRQIESIALRRLKYPSRSRRITDYLEQQYQEYNTAAFSSQ